MLEYCQRHAPHRALGEKQRERQLEEEQAQLAAQLIEIQTGRLELEEALAVSSEDLQSGTGTNHSLVAWTAHVNTSGGAADPATPARSRTFVSVQDVRRAEQPQRSHSQRETTQVKCCSACV